MEKRAIIGWERAVFACVFLFTYAVELVLDERKFGLFGGGFGQSHTLDAPLDIALFFAATLLAQGFALALLWVLLRRLLRRPEQRSRRLFSFVFFGVAISMAALAAKLELLSFFSDAVSFQLIRNLGGGSLTDAFLFAMNESALYAIGALAGLVVYGGVMWALARRARTRSAPIEARPFLRGRTVLILLIALPFVAFVADRVPNARYAANRMNAFSAVTAILSQLTDFDRDGYSLYSAQLDRQPFDSTRHPFALDKPDDGIDQDGFAGDFHYTGPEPRYVMPPLPAHKRNLVLIVLESTRFDALGKRIDGKLVMPNLTALAAQGSSIPEAYSHVGYTTESLKSLFSGQLDPQPGDDSIFRDLKRHGYRIGVFSGQPESFGGISDTVGEKASADVYVDAETLKDERASAFAAQGSLLVDEGKLLREFDRRMGDPKGWQQPTFVYFNFQSAHFPYHHDGMVDHIDPHPIARGDISAANRDHVEKTYYNATAYTDQRIGEVIAQLKALGVWDDTLLVVTADHGESLFDDNFLGHGHMINHQQLHIPFVLSQKGVTVDRPVGLDDYRAIMSDLLAGQAPVLPKQNVFHYIGGLDEPASIGLVDPGVRFTTFDLDTEAVGFSERGTKRRYDTWPAGSPDRARADRLIREWEKRRWDSYLARGGK